MASVVTHKTASIKAQLQGLKMIFAQRWASRQIYLYKRRWSPNMMQSNERDRTIGLAALIKHSYLADL